MRALTRTSYLRGLVVLVLLVTVTETLVDYVFKAQASGAFARQDDLLRFFAVFYTGVSLLTVLVQAGGSRIALQRLGLTRTVALLPAVTGLGSLGALLVPGLPAVSVARGGEHVSRNGLFRAGYELLFTPLPPDRKRASKLLVDVGVVRFGDITGALAVQVVLLMPSGRTGALLALAAALSGLGVWTALRLRRGYVRTLEQSLMAQAARMNVDDMAGLMAQTMALPTGQALGLTEVGISSIPELNQTLTAMRTRPTQAPNAAVPDATMSQDQDTARKNAASDPELDRIRALRGNDVHRCTAALISAPLSPALVPHVVPLLARDELLADTLNALRRVAPRVTGQLVDHLLDPDQPFILRRRLPLTLADTATERAMDGLFHGLKDERFEVRYRCGRVMNHLQELNAELEVSQSRVFTAVLDEVAHGRRVWESQRLLDSLEDEDWSPMVDEVLAQRANRSLEHVFTLLALVLQREPLRVAYRGLHTDDRMLQGTALEYLETALPQTVRQALWPFLEDPRPQRRSQRPADEILDDLLRSRQSIVLNLEELRRRRSGS